MTDELADRVCAVTGGARGIGLAVGRRLVSEGARLVVGDILVDEATDAIAELGPAARAVELDVRDWTAVELFFAGIVATEGRVDVSVHSAGINRIADSIDMEREVWDDIVATNLSGVFACSMHAARAMDPVRGGSIINIASAAGILPLAGRAPYSASKSAVNTVSKVLGAEWAQRRIRVNAISPGWVATDLVTAAVQSGRLSEESIRARVPMDRLAEPGEIAEAALFLASDRSSFFTGSVLTPDGGFTATGIR